MKIQVTKYQVRPHIIRIGTSGSYGIETLEFEFNEDWNGLTKKVSFYPADNSEGVVVILTEDKCDVPAELTAVAGTSKIVVEGFADDKRILSSTVSAFIEETENGASNEPVAPTPTEAEQALLIAKEAKEIAEKTGNVSEDQITNAVDKYLEENPPVGNAGENGATFTPSVSDDGVLSWTNDKGMENPESVNIKGEPGKDGSEGKSAYQIACDSGFEGIEAEWLASLKGKEGTPGKDGEDGINAEMYSHKVYKVYSVADIEARCDEVNSGRFYVINCGEAFNHVSTSGTVTTLNTGDICAIDSSKGNVSGLMVVDNQPIDVEEGTLIQWYEIDENGDYKERYTAMLSFGGSGADKDEIVEAVLSALPTWEGGSY